MTSDRLCRPGLSAYTGRSEISAGNVDFFLNFYQPRMAFAAALAFTGLRYSKRLPPYDYVDCVG
jgi:hypothetical protein